MESQEMMIIVEAEPKASARVIPIMINKVTKSGAVVPCARMVPDSGSGGKIKFWRQRVMGATQLAMYEYHWRTVPADTPVLVDIDWVFRVKGIPPTVQPHVIKPDRDNLDKCILDPMTRVGVWHDDCQVIAGHLVKWMHPVWQGARIYCLSGQAAIDAVGSRREFIDDLITKRLTF